VSRIAHVRRFNGFKTKPDSSRKLKVACPRRPFFNPRPLFAPPTLDRCLVTLARFTLRPLGRESEVVQNSHNVIGMVRHTKLALNNLTTVLAAPTVQTQRSEE
jgi:hypothetical protein